MPIDTPPLIELPYCTEHFQLAEGMICNISSAPINHIPPYLLENKNKWAGSGTWESGSRVLTGHRLKKRSDSDSDSEEDSREVPKSSSSRVVVNRSASAMVKESGADRCII